MHCCRFTAGEYKWWICSFTAALKTVQRFHITRYFSSAFQNVTIFADPRAFAALSGSYPADLLKEAGPDSFGTEFLDYKMSIRTVATLDEALAHIARNGSHHSEAIVAEDAEALAKFLRETDAACVYANASTAFTDGGQFGFGAEIGISTQNLHARGPMGLEALTTYKYLIEGTGQVRLA